MSCFWDHCNNWSHAGFNDKLQRKMCELLGGTLLLSENEPLPKSDHHVIIVDENGMEC